MTHSLTQTNPIRQPVGQRHCPLGPRAKVAAMHVLSAQTSRQRHGIATGKRARYEVAGKRRRAGAGSC